MFWAGVEATTGPSRKLRQPLGLASGQGLWATGHGPRGGGVGGGGEDTGKWTKWGVSETRRQQDQHRGREEKTVGFQGLWPMLLGCPY